MINVVSTLYLLLPKDSTMKTTVANGVTVSQFESLSLLLLRQEL